MHARPPYRNFLVVPTSRLQHQELLELLYDELREMAHRQRRRVPGGAEVVNTTAVINEVYLKFDRAGDVVANDRGHFLIIASRAMRQILIDYARQRKSPEARRRRAESHTEPRYGREALVEQQGERLLDIDLALKRL